MIDKKMKSLSYVRINDELSLLPLVQFDNVSFIVSLLQVCLEKFKQQAVLLRKSKLSESSLRKRTQLGRSSETVNEKRATAPDN